MKDIFDWKEYTEREKSQSKIENALMIKYFRQVLSGNSAYENLSTSEAETLLSMFKHGWILAQMAGE